MIKKFLTYIYNLFSKMKRTVEDDKKLVKKAKKFKKDTVKCENPVLEKDEENLKCQKLMKKKSGKKNNMQNDSFTKVDR